MADLPEQSLQARITLSSISHASQNTVQHTPQLTVRRTSAWYGRTAMVRRNWPRDGTDDSDSGESCVHSFVVKLWLEETEQGSGHAVWRGRISHVSSGERQFVKNPNEVSAFISQHLAKTEFGPGEWRITTPKRQVS